MSKIVFENVTKKFIEDVAVNDVSFDIKEKEFYSLLGPSGCGKTTTLRLLAGLEVPSEGRIIIDGKTVVDSEYGTFIPPSKRKLGLVFQNYAIWPHMTAKENILFGLKVNKVPEKEQEKRLDKVLERLQIPELMDRYPNEMSGGQQQRVALARELIRGVDILLMDEPLSNLDAKLRIEMRMELKKLHKEIEPTIIYVTHDQVEALTLSTRMSVMNNGKMAQIGTPDEIYYKPSNFFVAAFIGDVKINSIEAVIDRDNIHGDGFSMKLGIEEDFEFNYSDKEVLIAIRPQDIAVTKNQEVDNSIKAIVDTFLTKGDTQILQLKLAVSEKDILVTAEINRRTGNYEIGDEVYLILERDSMHIFDKETKVRLN